jgi:hypothetical protein
MRTSLTPGKELACLKVCCCLLQLMHLQRHCLVLLLRQLLQHLVQIPGGVA